MLASRGTSRRSTGSRCMMSKRAMLRFHALRASGGVILSSARARCRQVTLLKRRRMQACDTQLREPARSGAFAGALARWPQRSAMVPVYGTHRRRTGARDVSRYGSYCGPGLRAPWRRDLAEALAMVRPRFGGPSDRPSDGSPAPSAHRAGPPTLRTPMRPWRLEVPLGGTPPAMTFQTLGASWGCRRSGSLHVISMAGRRGAREGGDQNRTVVVFHCRPDPPGRVGTIGSAASTGATRREPRPSPSALLRPTIRRSELRSGHGRLPIIDFLQRTRPPRRRPIRSRSPCGRPAERRADAGRRLRLVLDAREGRARPGPAPGAARRRLAVCQATPSVPL